MTFDEACVALALHTGMSPEDWRDFIECTPDQQAALAKAYADAQWVTRRDVLAEVLQVLMLAAQVAGTASGIGSAYAVLRAL